MRRKQYTDTSDSALADESTSVAWPSGWSKPGPLRGVTGAVFFALFVVIAVAAGASGFDDPRALVLVALIPLFAGISLGYVALWVRARSRSTKRVSVVSQPDGTRSLEVPFTLTVCASMWLVGIGAVLGCAALVVFSVPAAVHGYALAWLAVALFGVLGLYFLLWVVEALRGHLRRGALYLSPWGMLYRGWGHDRMIAWDDVQTVLTGQSSNQTITVSPRSDVRPNYWPRSFLWRALGKRARVVADLYITGALLSIDPALAYHTVRFYHANPAARAELGTETAVQRVRGGAVVLP